MFILFTVWTARMILIQYAYKIWVTMLLMGQPFLVMNRE